MKTVLVPLFDGFIARNLLDTSVVDAIVHDDAIRVVIIPPKGKGELYAARFAERKNVVVETGPFWEHDRLEFITDKLYLHSIPTNFMRIRQADWYWNKGKYASYMGASLLRILGRFRAWHAVLRALHPLFPVPAYNRELIERWKPDVIFAPTMIMRDELALMRFGKECGAAVVGMVKSWDNLTSKAFLRQFPDVMIVHTEIVATEAQEIYGYPKDRIRVTGLPQYDRYLDPGFTDDRETFFKTIGADPAKRLITYAPAGDWMSMHDKEVLSQILDWIDDGTIPNAQVLLRLHPTYISQTEELVGRAHLIAERPGTHFKAENKEQQLRTVEFGEADMRHLASTMRWSDVTVNTASTMTIEAAIFDTPTVLIGYDGTAKLSYWKSVRRYYDREHYVPILKTQGAALARTPEEMKGALLRYLQDRSLDAEGRARIRTEQCYMLDGKSGQRVANVIRHAAGVR